MRYPVLFLLLWPTVVGAQNYGQTMDTNHNPVTGFELFVGGVETVGKSINVGLGPGIDADARPGGRVDIFNATGPTYHCYGGSNDGAVCSNFFPVCPSGFCLIADGVGSGALSTGQVQINSEIFPLDAFVGVDAYSARASTNLDASVCTEFARNYLYYSAPENRWKKCSAGVVTDLDGLGQLDTCTELYLNLNPTLGDNETSGFCGKVLFSEYPTLNYPIVTGGQFFVPTPSILPSDCVPNLWDTYVDANGVWQKCEDGVLKPLGEPFATCQEFRDLLDPASAITGLCGAVVLSAYPTITQPTILNELTMLANDIYGPQDCIAGGYALYPDASEGRWKKCQNGVLTDLDVAIATPTATVTPTPTVTVTATPVTCATESSGIFGGAYTVRPESCKSLPASLTYTGAVALGPGPTATAAATPTATAATPTATGVTPTPTPTASPPLRFLGAVEIEGDLTFSPATSRTVQVGTCKVPPCTGVALTLLGGNANSAGSATGGAIALQGGTAAGLNNGGTASLIAGLGGGNAIVTARLGFLNTGGEVYLDGNLNSRVAASGNAPTIGTCGTTPSIVGTNNALRATIGTGGTASACTITFADGGFANAPVCTANYDTAPDGVLRTQTSTTAVIITNYDDTIAGTWVAGAYPASAVLNVLCVGRE